jgi:hypothetical protein
MLRSFVPSAVNRLPVLRVLRVFCGNCFVANAGQMTTVDDSVSNARSLA